MSKQSARIHESQMRYKQGLGQNFIYDDGLLASLVSLSGVTGEDAVLEVGPGCGTMTKHLCRAAGKVLAVEIDERLIPVLTAFLADFDNVTVIEGDALTMPLDRITAILGERFSVVANIPYYITTPLILKFLDAHLPIPRICMMVQQEVAEKILARPGTGDYGMLAVKCQYYCEPEILMHVPAACFEPVPKVDSAFIALPFRASPAVSVKSEKIFFRTAQAAFLMRRKTMVNNLQAAFSLSKEKARLALNACGLDERIRGERLTLAQFAQLADYLVETERIG